MEPRSEPVSEDGRARAAATATAAAAVLFERFDDDSADEYRRGNELWQWQWQRYWGAFAAE